MTEKDEKSESDIPVPKYRVGDIIFAAGCKQVQEAVTCPDCLGQRKWLVRTPGGEQFEVPCGRCASSYTQLPGITATNFVPEPRTICIRSIEARSCKRHSAEEGPSVTYFNGDNCCGTTIEESKAFATRDEALPASVSLAAEMLASWKERNSKQVNREELRAYHIREALKGEALVELREIKEKYDKAISEITELPDQSYMLPFSSDRPTDAGLKVVARYLLNELGESIPEEWGEE